MILSIVCLLTRRLLGCLMVMGWRLDADIARGDTFRVIQFTPTHSACSIAFGVGVTTGEPGSLRARPPTSHPGPPC